ncbi:MMPL family transporter [Lentilactobacillus raoultii]|uniref:MMPL family transporter n=1 Tax=Lentilactobacillus raoultii TaxID=1987503 RepID=A0ABW3PH96_9LACO|nr:MMPL family transporter [Lentilactobacillus raoultii]
MHATILKLHKNRVFTLLVWLIMIFIAIISAPSVTNTLQSHSQPTFSAKSQPTQAAKLRNQWGYHLANTTSVNVVYENPTGKLTTNQQKKIQSVINRLKKHRSFYSISRVVSPDTNVSGQAQLLSRDGSTQLVSLDINAKNNLRILTNELSGQVKVPGLRSYVTSPEIIRDVSNQKNAQITKIILVALFVASTLIVGLYFRAPLAAAVSFMSLFAAFVTAYSLSLNLAKHFNWAFSQYVPLEIGLATLVLGTIWNIYLYRKFRSVLTVQQEARAATKQTIQSLRFPIVTVGGCLTILFALCGFINFNEIRALWTLAMTYPILILAVLTLNAVFMAALGESLFWPSGTPQATMKSHYWRTATEFSLWQPIAGFLVALYITLPFIYFYHNSLSFSAMTNLTETSQAVKGARVLQAHFGEGKATPVTIYLKANQPLNNEKDLQSLDQLTSKLQHTKGVQNVYSLTQPGGMPIDKYYVANQLDAIGLSSKEATGRLSQASNSLHSNAAKLDLKALKRQVNQLSTMVTKSNQIVQDSSRLAAQVNRTAANSSVTVQQNASKRVRRYQQQINQLAQSLQSVSSGVGQLATEGKVIQSYGQNSYNNLQSYSRQINQVKQQLKRVNQQVTASTSQLNGIYDYLNGLQKSGGASIYYITKAQLADTDFQQTLLNYASQNKRLTTLQVVFKNAPSSQTTVHQIKRLQQQIDLQLRGTSLSQATVAITGEPVAQSIIQSKMTHHFTTLMAILVFGILLAVFILSRAILQPFYWTAAFVMSALTGFQLTYLTMHFVASVKQFDWQVPLLAAVILAAFGAWQIIALGLSYRYTELSLLDWILPTMTSYGQIVRYILLVVVILSIALTFGASLAMIETALIVIYTAFIFYLVLPMIVSSLGKLAVTLPDKKNILKNK